MEDQNQAAPASDGAEEQKPMEGTEGEAPQTQEGGEAPAEQKEEGSDCGCA